MAFTKHPVEIGNRRSGNVISVFLFINIDGNRQLHDDVNCARNFTNCEENISG